MPCQQNSTGAASTIPNPYVEAKTVEDTKSSVALVYRKVLSPLRADNTGPNIESGPIQYNRMAVLSPSDSLLSLLPLDLRSTNCLNLPSKSSIRPTTPPMASDRMNSTGYLLSCKWDIVAFSPMASKASPRPSKSTCLYLSVIPICKR